MFLLFFNSSASEGQADFWLTEQYPKKIKVCKGFTAFENNKNNEKVRVSINCQFPFSKEKEYQTELIVRFDEKKLYILDKNGNSNQPMPWNESLANILKQAFNITQNDDAALISNTSKKSQVVYLTQSKDNGIVLRVKELSNKNLTTHIEIKYLDRSVSLQFFPKNFNSNKNLFNPD